ncbi:BAG domain-containing protein [Trichostrongylus colubriformis]|uniref:BAG family molecular chaperone regulator 1 n=1 Tax=Trichostrongylus colubriformis TaxID=6319 RepID=A0AAN8EMH5_TRICO
MLVKVSVGSKTFPLKIGEDEGSISTLGELRTHVAKEANIEASRMKIIHRGKTVTGGDDLSLLDMNFKDNDKIMIMGQVSSSLKDDPGFSSLVAYEKANLMGLQKQHEQIETDLSAMELNFLDVQKSLEMVKRMEKRLAHFTETSMKHLEALDSLNIIGELTSEEQAVRNREKRKSLIDGINTLLNGNDKHVRRLEEYKKKLLGEIIE